MTKVLEVKFTPLVNCPIRPEKEFTQINNADTAAASFMFPQWKSKITGVSIIPPPMPIKPDNPPITIPTIMATNIDGFLIFEFLKSFLKSILKMAKNNTPPRIFLYIHKSKDQMPPTNAAGIEPEAKCMKRFLLKYLIL